MVENVINNVILELRYDESLAAQNGALNVAESHFYDYMFDKIQKVIDSFEGYDLSIDSISIDLGKIIPEDVPYKLEEMLRAEIEKHIVTNDHLSSYDNIGGQDSTISNDARLCLDNPSTLSQLLDFICTEKLPWDADIESFDPEKWWNENIGIIHSDSHFSSMLFRLCINDASVFARLLIYSTDTTIKEIVQGWIQNDEIVSNAKKDIIKILLEVKSMEEIVPVKTEFVSLVFVLAILFEPEDDEIFVTGLKQNPVRIAEQKGLNFKREDIIERLLTEAQCHSTPLNFIRRIIREGAVMSNAREERQKLTKTEFAGYEAEDSSSVSEKMNGSTAKVIVNTTEENVGNEAYKRYFNTDVAGIVLLNPFLTSYFQQVGILDDERNFIDLQKQIRAVHLIRYLSGKRGKHYGHLMNLEKILCGLSPYFPVPVEFEITEKEEEEAKNLYEAVSQYWESVRNTSMPGIQASFIQRDGIISYEDPYWLLRVESSAIDILMDNLPWGISTIIFPWMEKDIWTEWQYEH